MIDIDTAYSERDRQLRAACAVALGCKVASDADYVSWLIDAKRLGRVDKWDSQIT